jgi:hypothetical protein
VREEEGARLKHCWQRKRARAGLKKGALARPNLQGRAGSYSKHQQPEKRAYKSKEKGQICPGYISRRRKKIRGHTDRIFLSKEG